jgi:cobyrinic acid a,c-diamide synthase
LGLITPAEMESVQQKLHKLGALAEKYIDLENLLAIAETACDDSLAPVSPAAPTICRIAVARDKAFCFLYSENIELLQSLGAEIVFFSPLQEDRLPDDIQGLYLCGGYPELYLDALSANESMRRAIKSAVEGGLPTLAECGGFMYLHRAIEAYKMVGLIDAEAYKTAKLQRFGYTELIATHANLLCDAGESIRAHEFHFYESTDPGGDFLARKPFHEQTRPCVHATDTLYAGFAHLFLPANPRFAENFIRKAAKGRVC